MRQEILKAALKEAFDAGAQRGSDETTATYQDFEDFAPDFEEWYKHVTSDLLTAPNDPSLITQLKGKIIEGVSIIEHDEGFTEIKAIYFADGSQATFTGSLNYGELSVEINLK